MTGQEIFDKVARHLLTQKARSYLSPADPTCAYRGRNGKKCAIGCLIEDDKYDLSLERHGISFLLSAGILPSGCECVPELLADLLSVHDVVCDVRNWSAKLIQVAERHRLDTGVVHATLP